MQKRGQTLNIITGTVIGLMILIFMIFAVLFGISTLNPAGFFTANSAEYNATQSLTANMTSGVAKFGGYIPTIMTILAVVLCIAGIVLLVFYVRRMQGAGGSSTGGL